MRSRRCLARRVIYSWAGARRCARRALCGAGGGDTEARSTVFVHVQAEALADDAANAVTEDNAIIPIVSVQRLLCDAAVNAVVEAPDGSVVGLGLTTRTPSAWMMRQLRHRDRACTFPGCGNRRFTHAHHIEWWSRGGRTDLDNLALVCTFTIGRCTSTGGTSRGHPTEVRSFRPGGVRYGWGRSLPDLIAS